MTFKNSETANMDRGAKNKKAHANHPKPIGHVPMDSLFKLLEDPATRSPLHYALRQGAKAGPDEPRRLRFVDQSGFPYFADSLRMLAFLAGGDGDLNRPSRIEPLYRGGKSKSTIWMVGYTINGMDLMCDRQIVVEAKQQQGARHKMPVASTAIEIPPRKTYPFSDMKVYKDARGRTYTVSSFSDLTEQVAGAGAPLRITTMRKPGKGKVGYRINGLEVFDAMKMAA